jgi:hypothetical protein
MKLLPHCFKCCAAGALRNGKSRARIQCAQRPPDRSAKILKDKHIKLKLKAEKERAEPVQEELSAVALLTTPRCHPDGAAIRRSERVEAIGGLRTEKRRLSPVFDALGWHMAERLQQSPLLAGDPIDIAFTVGQNEKKTSADTKKNLTYASPAAD